MALPSQPTDTLDSTTDQGVSETTTSTTTGEPTMNLTTFDHDKGCSVLNPEAFPTIINAFHPDYVKTYMPEFLSTIRLEETQKANGVRSGGKAKASRESVNKGAFTISQFPKTKAKVKKVDLKPKDYFTFQKAGMPKGVK